MTAAAIVLVLVAANFHAVWNLLLKESSDPLPFATKAAIVSAIIWSPIVLLGWEVSGRPAFPPSVWLLATVSALLEVAYFIFLSRAYRLGQLSAVYPLARGAAPVLAVGVGLLVLQEKLSSIELAGVLLVLVGIWLVQRPTPAGAATFAALLTACTIASYSAIDSVAVHQAPAWLYGWIVWAITAGLLFGRSIVLPRVQRSTADRAVSARWADIPLGRSALVGMLMTTTYFLILIALRLAPLAVVAPLRESSVVLVTIWGIWRLREREGIPLRLAGAIGIAIGATLIVV